MRSVSLLHAARRGAVLQSVDIVVAGLLTAGVLAEVDAVDHRLIAVATIVATTTTTAWRRRAPTTAALVALSSYITFEVATQSSSVLEPAALVPVCYTLGAQSFITRRAVRTTGVVLGASLIVALLTRGTLSLIDEASGWMLFVAAPLALGYGLARRGLLARQLDAATNELAQENELSAQRAAMEDRLRIARELHDIVAHNVSVMVIQTAAARRIAAADRDRALEALGVVERSGREALVEMRRVIGALRRAEGEDARAPTLAELDELMSRAHTSGLEVALDIQGTRRVLSPELESVAFRVVQEALTNVLKHAGPTRACVTLTYGETTLELGIDNVASVSGGPLSPSGGGGHGLTGMRERLSLYGGSLDAAPRDGGGFRVEALLPLESRRA